MSRNILHRLLYGEVGSRAPFTTIEEAAAVLDYLAVLDQKRNDDDPIADRAVELLAMAIRHDLDVRRLLEMLSPAVLLDDPSEERAPSARVALEAHRAIERLEALAEEQARDKAWWNAIPRIVRALLPTTLHARYVLSTLVVHHEESDDAEVPGLLLDIFRLVADALVEVGGNDAVEREYAERLTRRLMRRPEATREAEGEESVSEGE